jgi:hypothetical protein
VLAAIGSIETDHGRSRSPGVRSGVNRNGCCAGPMQFNLRDGPPSTWERYGVDGNDGGSANVYDPEDAIPSAANYLAALRRANDNLTGAILGYNHSAAYVREVLARARAYARGTEGEFSTPVDAATAPTDCVAGGLDVTTGPANLRTAQRVGSPQRFRALPAWSMAGASVSGEVDARLYDDVVWILRRYHLRVTAARKAGHHAHGDGTAVDLGPADGNTQAAWDGSAGRLAHDLGWTAACGRSGTRPACHLAPAISSSAMTATPATAHRAPAAAAAPHICTFLGPRRATAPVVSLRPAHGSWPSTSCRPTTRPPRGRDPKTAEVSEVVAPALRTSAVPLGQQPGRRTGRCKGVPGLFGLSCGRRSCRARFAGRVGERVRLLEVLGIAGAESFERLECGRLVVMFSNAHVAVWT